jgi:hypothetical protein
MNAHSQTWRLCLPYLPKPKWRTLGYVSSCSNCGALYVSRVLGRYGSPVWQPVEMETE